MRRLIICLWMIIGMSACATSPAVQPSATPADTATPNEIIVTPDATRLNRDLPPTWTPTDTPTITPTPTVTLTRTPTPSPTPIDFDALCAAFSGTTAIEDGDTYDEDDTIRMTYGITPDYGYVYVGVVLEHDDLDGAIADILPGGTTYTSSFEIADFPYAGRWDYRIGAFLLDGDDMLCSQEGYFVVAEKTQVTAQPNLIPTAMPFPSITPRADPTDVPCYFFCDYK